MEQRGWGLLVLDKPAGLTSHTAVQRVRRALGAAKAGHAGTLDPLASGVLLVGIGKATRLLEFLVGQTKGYRARIRLGQRRDTLDREGQVVDTRPVPPLGRTEVETLLERFQGTIRQTPPVFSAVKLQGVPLHRRTRRGETVAPPERSVEILRLELIDLCSPDLVVEVDCSKGTYVRSLARDIGEALGTGATLWELTRLRSGPFSLDDAVSLAEVERRGAEAWSVVRDPAAMVQSLPAVRLAEEEISTLARGLPLESAGQTAGQLVAVFDPRGQLAAVARGEANSLKPYKVFREANPR